MRYPHHRHSFDPPTWVQSRSDDTLYQCCSLQNTAGWEVLAKQAVEFRLLVSFHFFDVPGCHMTDRNIVHSWCISDRASWIDYILITNLMHWLLFIHKIQFSSTSFEPQVLIFRRRQLYTCSIWYCHSLWEFVVACRYTARVNRASPWDHRYPV